MSEYQEFTGKTVEEALRARARPSACRPRRPRLRDPDPGQPRRAGHGRRAGPDHRRAALGARWRRSAPRGSRGDAAAAAPAARELRRSRDRATEATVTAAATDRGRGRADRDRGPHRRDRGRATDQRARRTASRCRRSRADAAARGSHEPRRRGRAATATAATAAADVAATATTRTATDPAQLTEREQEEVRASRAPPVDRARGDPGGRGQPRGARGRARDPRGAARRTWASRPR